MPERRLLPVQQDASTMPLSPTAVPSLLTTPVLFPVEEAQTLESPRRD
jgi:hypothetical protein